MEFQWVLKNTSGSAGSETRKTEPSVGLAFPLHRFVLHLLQHHLHNSYWILIVSEQLFSTPVVDATEVTEVTTVVSISSLMSSKQYGVSSPFFPVEFTSSSGSARSWLPKCVPPIQPRSWDETLLLVWNCTCVKSNPQLKCRISRFSMCANPMSLVEH